MIITGQVPIYETPVAPANDLCRLERDPHNQCVTAVLVHPSRWDDFEAELGKLETKRAEVESRLTTSYSAEPDPTFVTSEASLKPWRVRARTDGEDPLTIVQYVTREEALACERALSTLPGAAPVDEVARYRIESTKVSVVASAVVGDDGELRELPVEQPDGQVSSAPFVPYSPEDVAEVAKAARLLIERKLAPSVGMTEALARAVVTLAEMVVRAYSASRTLADLRNEARALYASYVAAIGEIAPYESTHGFDIKRARHRFELVRLGAFVPTEEPA